MYYHTIVKAVLNSWMENTEHILYLQEKIIDSKEVLQIVSYLPSRFQYLNNVDFLLLEQHFNQVCSVTA